MAKRKVSAAAYKKKFPIKKDVGDDSLYPVDRGSRILLDTLKDDPKATPEELELRDNQRRGELQGLLGPKNEVEVGPWGTDVNLPGHPYPFRNPVSMTKDLDRSVRDLRTTLAPGAGTARDNIIDTKPPYDYIAEAIRPKLREPVLKGLMDPRELSLLGSADPRLEGSNQVYINDHPRTEDRRDRTVAHELSHRNIPFVDDGWGDINSIGKGKPGAEYVNQLYDKLKGLGSFSSKKARGAEEESAVEEIVRRLREAGIGAKVQKR
jgi:hypothetical protein